MDLIFHLFGKGLFTLKASTMPSCSVTLLLFSVFGNVQEGQQETSGIYQCHTCDAVYPDNNISLSDFFKHFFKRPLAASTTI